jgi:hypothetical protein
MRQIVYLILFFNLKSNKKILLNLRCEASVLSAFHKLRQFFLNFASKSNTIKNVIKR